MSVTFSREPHAAPVLQVLATIARDAVHLLGAPARHPAGIELEVVSDLDTLARYADPWNRLVFGTARYRPQASYAYVASYLEHLRAPDQRWACVIARRGDAVIGVLPFAIAPARVAGDKLDAASLDADLVVAPGEEAAAIPALLGGLAKAAPGWVDVHFTELQAGSPTVARLERDPGPVVLVASGRSSYLTLPATYDAYLTTVGSHFRQNLRRQTRKLFALPDVTVEYVTDASVLPAFIAVEATGWKGSEGNAVARRPALAAYYRAVTERLAAAGALEWAVLRTEGRPIAAFLMVHLARKLALDKIAYDAALAQLAPGNVLMGLVIERAIASGQLDEIDFLTDHEWNRRWQAETRDTYDVAIYRHAPRAMVDAARRAWRGSRP